MSAKLRDDRNRQIDRIVGLIAKAKRPAVACALAALAAILAFLLFLQLEGCALSWGGSEPLEVGAVAEGDLWTAEDCRSYDAAYVAFTASSSAAAGLSGAAGLAIAAWPDPPEDAIVGLGLAGLGLGAVAATFAGLASLYAQRFAERCTDQEWMSVDWGPAAPAVP